MGTPLILNLPISSSLGPTSHGRQRDGLHNHSDGSLHLVDFVGLFLDIKVSMVTPIPPWRAIAIARRASVTVSIITLASGMFRLMFLVKRHFVSTASGNTSDAAGEAARHQRSIPLSQIFRPRRGRASRGSQRTIGFLSNGCTGRLPYALRQEHG